MYQPTSDETLQEREPLPHLGGEFRVRHELALPHGEVEHLLWVVQQERSVDDEVPSNELGSLTDHAIHRLFIVTLHDEQLLLKLKPSIEEEAFADLIRQTTAASLPLQPDFVDSFGISVVDRRVLGDERTEVPSILDQLHEHGTATRPLPNGRIEWFRRSADDPSVVLTGLMPEIALPSNTEVYSGTTPNEPVGHSSDSAGEASQDNDTVTEVDPGELPSAEPEMKLEATAEQNEIFHYQWWLVRTADGSLDIEDEEGKTLGIDPKDKEEIIAGLGQGGELIIYRERDDVYQRTKYRLLRTADDAVSADRIPVEVTSETGPLENLLVKPEEEWTGSDGDDPEDEPEVFELPMSVPDASTPLPSVDLVKTISELPASTSEPIPTPPTVDVIYSELTAEQQALGVSAFQQPTATKARAKQTPDVPKISRVPIITEMRRTDTHRLATRLQTPTPAESGLAPELMRSKQVSPQVGDTPYVRSQGVDVTRLVELTHAQPLPLAESGRLCADGPLDKNEPTTASTPTELSNELSSTYPAALRTRRAPKELHRQPDPNTYRSDLPELETGPLVHFTPNEYIENQDGSIPTPEPIQSGLIEPLPLEGFAPPPPRSSPPERHLDPTLERRHNGYVHTQHHQRSVQTFTKKHEIQTGTTTPARATIAQEARHSERQQETKERMLRMSTQFHTATQREQSQSQQAANQAKDARTSERKVSTNVRSKAPSVDAGLSHRQNHRVRPQRTTRNRTNKQMAAEPFGVPNTAQAVIEAVLARKAQRAVLPGQSQPGLKLIVHHPGQVSPSRIRGLSQLISSIAGFSAVGELYHDRFATHLLTDSPILQAEFITHLQHHRVERVQNRWQYWLTA